MNITFKPSSIILMDKIVMTDGVLYIDGLSYKARSGGWGNGSLPHGKYIVNNPVKRTISIKNKPFMLEGYPWSIGLTPLFKTDRTYLLIHADGGYKGTLGCLAIYENDINCFEMLEQIIKKESVYLYVL